MLAKYHLRGIGRAVSGGAWGCVALLALGVACQVGPIGPGELTEEPTAAPPAPLLAQAELASGAVLDMGADDSQSHVLDGFSLPEAVGARRASWSEGEVASVAFHLLGAAKSYQVTFLAEPYHELGELAVGLSMNKRATGEATVSRGWRAYRVVVPGDKVNRGRNELAFHFSKTGRPSDFNPQSTDVRQLGMRFEQIQVQPITNRAELAFGSRNATALASLGEGWALDPSDKGTGTWTVGQRAQIKFALEREPASPSAAASYRIDLDARTPRGVSTRSVRVSLNGAPLGELAFGDKKTTRGFEIPAERLAGENELVLEFGQLEPYSTLDPKSKDDRLLGLRVFHLDVAPKEVTELNVASKG